MEWIIGILAAFLILLLLKLVGILRQIRDICRQLTFLKDYDSNDYRAGGFRAFEGIDGRAQ